MAIFKYANKNKNVSKAEYDLGKRVFMSHLIREYRALITEVPCSNKSYKLYQIEGQDIPQGMQEINLEINYITKDCFTIKITKV